jgi:hypothetical protein
VRAKKDRKMAGAKGNSRKEREGHRIKEHKRVKNGGAGRPGAGTEPYAVER